MDTRRAFLLGFGLLAMTCGTARAAGSGPKYYFRVVDVKAQDQTVIPVAKELLEKELGRRPEFTSALEAPDEAALVAALAQRKLRGFSVTLRVDRLEKEVKAPKPGGRLKQLAVDVKVSVFGATLPGEKLAFSGEGEVAAEGEVIETRIEQESAALMKDVLEQAVKQAVDQAVTKLSPAKSSPPDGTKRKRKKK